MSDELGPLAFVPPANAEDIGHCWSQTTAARIDDETERIVRAAWATATSVLLANRPALEALAGELVSAETVEGPALAALLAGVVPPADARLWTELASLSS